MASDGRLFGSVLEFSDGLVAGDDVVKVSAGVWPDLSADHDPRVTD